jgi:hypothetical protein
MTHSPVVLVCLPFFLEPRLPPRYEDLDAANATRNAPVEETFHFVTDAEIANSQHAQTARESVPLQESTPDQGRISATIDGLSPTQAGIDRKVSPDSKVNRHKTSDLEKDATSETQLSLDMEEKAAANGKPISDLEEDVLSGKPLTMQFESTAASRGSTAALAQCKKKKMFIARRFVMCGATGMCMC